VSRIFKFLKKDKPPVPKNRAGSFDFSKKKEKAQEEQTQKNSYQPSQSNSNDLDSQQRVEEPQKMSDNPYDFRQNNNSNQTQNNNKSVQESPTMSFDFRNSKPSEYLSQDKSEASETETINKESQNIQSEYQESDAQTQEQENQETLDSNKEQTSSVDKSFFEDVKKKVKQGLNESNASEIVKKDMVEEMKNYHKTSEVTNRVIAQTESLNKEVEKKLEELKSLESDWKSHHKEMKAAEDLMVKKESDINFKLGELKNIIKHIRAKALLDIVPSEENFFKIDGMQTIRTVRELVQLLKSSEGQSVYEKHVHGETNDFANWIEHVFNQSTLASKLRMTKNREEFINIILKLF